MRRRRRAPAVRHPVVRYPAFTHGDRSGNLRARCCRRAGNAGNTVAPEHAAAVLAAWTDDEAAPA